MQPRADYLLITLHFVLSLYIYLSYNCCAQCCRDNKNSVCRVHGTGYQAALAQVDAATHYQFFEFDLRYGKYSSLN